MPLLKLTLQSPIPKATPRNQSTHEYSREPCSHVARKQCCVLQQALSSAWHWVALPTALVTAMAVGCAVTRRCDLSGQPG